MGEVWWDVGRRLQNDLNWDRVPAMRKTANSRAAQVLFLVAFLPYACWHRALYWFLDKTLSHKHRKDCLIIYLFRKNVLSLRPCAFVDLSSRWGPGRGQAMDVCVRVENRLVWARLGT